MSIELTTAGRLASEAVQKRIERDYGRGLRPAWAGAGKRIEGATCAADAMRQAGLAWGIDKVPLVTPAGRIAPKVATVRSDTGAVLGVVGPDYHVFDNAAAFDFLDTIVGKSEAEFHAAGEVKGGRSVWCLARLPGMYEAGPDDLIEPFTLLSTGHDGGRGVRIQPFTMRMVCANGMIRPFSDRLQTISLRHTSGLAGRIERARHALRLAADSVELFAERARIMARRKLHTDELRAFWNCLFPTQPGTDGASLASYLAAVPHATAQALAPFVPRGAITGKQAERNRLAYSYVRDNFRNERNNLPGMENSVWSALNAVTEYVDHQAKVRGRGMVARAESRLSSTFWGPGAALKAAAYDAALALSA